MSNMATNMDKKYPSYDAKEYTMYTIPYCYDVKLINLICARSVK